MPALVIREDLPATELRRLARHEPDRRAAMRLLAIAHALDGFSRAEAARLAGMERQALRDAVRRYNWLCQRTMAHFADECWPPCWSA
jgi:hypothetical protein